MNEPEIYLYFWLLLFLLFLIVIFFKEFIIIIKQKCHGKVLEKPFFSSSAYAVFRIMAALLFLQHGLQKIFGAFGGVGGSGQGLPDIFSLIGWAGIIELIAGALIALGVFVRPLAMIAVIEMAVAYFMAHVSKGFYPIQNGGELALIYLFSFLIIAIYGAGKLSLEKMLLGKELF